MFKKLKNGAENYLAMFGCLDVALLKTCVLAVGILIGLAVSGRRKKAVTWGAALVFVATYIPLMYKFIPCLKDAFAVEADEDDEADEDADWDDFEEIEVEYYE
ncbi:permease of phosphate ABC transporter [Bengtsoniella intestinalis]|uniref:permease of phosphate ABC transporter n=1 Tax=Bengtsoniella intestinalis TaxID=3073143 RepID=UPI00391FAC2D